MSKHTPAAAAAELALLAPRLYEALRWALPWAERGHEAAYPGESYEKDGYVADSVADARAVLKEARAITEGRGR